MSHKIAEPRRSNPKSAGTHGCVRALAAAVTVAVGDANRPSASQAASQVQGRSAADEMYEPLQWSRTFEQWSRWRREPAGRVQVATLGCWRTVPRTVPVDELDDLLIQPRVYAYSSRQIP